SFSSGSRWRASSISLMRLTVGRMRRSSRWFLLPTIFWRIHLIMGKEKDFPEFRPGRDAYTPRVPGASRTNGKAKVAQTVVSDRGGVETAVDDQFGAGNERAGDRRSQQQGRPDQLLGVAEARRRS